MSDLPNGSKKPQFVGTITLGSVIATLPGLVLVFGAIWWTAGQSNKNEAQDTRLSKIESFLEHVITEDDAKTRRELRDAQIEGLKSVLESQQVGFKNGLDLLSSRMDRISERIDRVSDIANKVDTTLGIMQRQSRNFGGPATAAVPRPGVAEQ